MVSPVSRKAAVRQLTEGGRCSERRACELVGISRTAQRRKPQAEKEEAQALRGRIKRLSRKNPRWGNPRITAQLRREGWKVNKKRVHRIRKEEGLPLPRKRPSRRKCGWNGSGGDSVKRAERANPVWSYDFAQDQTERGGRLRILAIVDEFTRECLLLPVAPRMNAQVVIDALQWLFLTRGVPTTYIRSDNGPEFIEKGLQKWLEKQGCQTSYIRPGSPWENGVVESFIGKLRDECLNMEIFQDLGEAQTLIEAWREDYNQRRPHSALGYQTPVEFAASVPSAAPATPPQHLAQKISRERELILT